MRRTVLDQVHRHFRPEFLNRLDEFIVFHALEERHLKEIVRIQLKRLEERLAERHLQLVLSDPAADYLVRAGYDPAFGARPLKRAIQREVENRMARLILAGKIREGDTIEVGFDEKQGELVFTPVSPTPEAATLPH
jgi:ATP-dependent Clp protease ATP-binding subunit ClpB